MFSQCESLKNKMRYKNKVLLLGGIITDHYFEVENYPGLGQDTLILNSFDKIGGCAINVAVTLNNLGSIPYIVSKLGDDQVGKKIWQYMQSLDLPTDCIVVIPGKNSGYCLTIIDRNGERTFFTYNGCEKEFSIKMLPVELLREISFVYISGYYLLNDLSTSMILEFLEGLRQNKCQILFDPGPLVGKIDPFQLLKMIGLSTWIVPNLSELAMIKLSLGIEADPVEWLLNQGCQYVVVKKGDQGVDFYSSGANLSLKSFRVKAIDSTGAGDSFAGGLIHALSNGENPTQALELAIACGAYIATIEGPHGIFTSEELKHFAALHKE